MLMKNAAFVLFVIFAVLRLTADDNPPIDITTADGTLYANATVLNVNAATVDISYLDSNNMPVLRCLKLKDLSNDLQARFNFDPAVAAESERKQTLWRQNEFTELKNQENELIKQISLLILQRQGGQNVPIDLDDLYNAVYEGKTMAAGFVISYGPAGALVNINGSNGGSVIPDNIIILDLDAPAQTNWAGYIYPTMMISSQRLNIYCTHPVNAINSVISTLKLDNNNSGSASTAADPAATASATTAVTDPAAVSASPSANTAANISSTVTDPNTNAVIPAVNNVYVNGGGGYYGGGFVYPAAVQPYIHPWPHPYPYQPHPLYNNNNNWSNRNNLNNPAVENRAGEFHPNSVPGGGNFNAPRSDFSGRGWGSGGSGGHFRR